MSYKDTLAQVTEKVTGITPSVVALAVAMGADPVKFADLLSDGEEATDKFVQALHTALYRAIRAQEKEAKTKKND